MHDNRNSIPDCSLRARVVVHTGARSTTGALRVLVTDASQGVVPGATVDVVNAATNDRRTAVTDGTGYANFVPVTRGAYTVTVTLSGFKTVEVANVRVDVNERRFLTVSLQVAAAAETIKVVSKSAVIQTEDGSIGQVIQGAVAVELPLAGRRYTELALLVPGTAPTSQTLETRGPGWFVSNGNYQTQNNFVLDGFDNNGADQRAVDVDAGRAAVARCDRRVQGADQQLLGRIRSLGRRGHQRVAALGHEPRGRLGLLLQPRQGAREQVVVG
jgi:hypothetical protein